jgi:L-lactate dehydrogenase complex protein LldG
MQETTAKEQMLKKIRKALIEKRDNPYAKLEETSPIYPQQDELLEVIFAEEFTRINGQFVFCEDEISFGENLKGLIAEKKWDHVYCWERPLQNILNKNQITHLNTDHEFIDHADVGVTLCEAIAARTGSIMVSNGNEAGRRLSIYPHAHVVVAYTSQLYPDIKEALNFIKQKYEGKIPSMISNTTGPSRTADIEKTLVLGAHGPKEIFCFLIDDSQ